jgi:hypothetical protein
MSFLTKLPRSRFVHFDVDQEKFSLGVAKAMWAIRIPPTGSFPRKSRRPFRRPVRKFLSVIMRVQIVTFAGTDPLVLTNWITDFDITPTNTGAANGFTREPWTRPTQWQLFAHWPRRLTSASPTLPWPAW